MERLEPLELLERAMAFGLNGAQRLNDLNVLNKLLVAAVSDMPNMTR
jgi:hypothetical protein